MSLHRHALWLTCLLAPGALLGCPDEGSKDEKRSDAGDSASVETDAALTGDAAVANPAASWAECSERAHVLRGGGKSFGECQGDCKFELDLSNILVLDTSQCAGYGATLTISDAAGAAQKTINATLTADAWLKGEQLGAALAEAKLDAMYGCPDCADGGASWVSTQTDDGWAEKHVYEFGNAPAVLAEADAFVQALITQLTACQGQWVESCSGAP